MHPGFCILFIEISGGGRNARILYLSLFLVELLDAALFVSQAEKGVFVLNKRVLCFPDLKSRSEKPLVNKHVK